MKKVKYIPMSYSHANLTPFKVYDVYDCIPRENGFYIQILINKGRLNYFYFDPIDVGIFIDVTSEYRCQVINEILL